VIAFFEKLADSNLRVGLVLTVLIVAAYSNVISGPLFFDDLHFISWNEHVTDFEVAEIYRTSVTDGAGFPSNTYRPNQQLVFALVYKVFGATPQPYHMISILVHLINSFLVFALLVRLGFSRAGALLASIFFAVHPIQSESVSYVSGFAGPFALFFLLGGIIRWVASLEMGEASARAIQFGLALALFSLAFFTKANMVILAPLTVVIAAYLVLVGRVGVTRYLVGSVLCFSSMSFAYFYLKLTVLNFTGSIGMVEGSNLYTENLWVRISTFISVLHNYLKMILWPVDLSYSKPDLRYLNPFTMEGMIGLIVLAMGIAAILKARERPRIFLGMAWFFAALAPFSGVIPLTSMYLEHWLYVPLVGVAILMAEFYQTATQRARQVAVAMLVPFVLLCVTRTAMRNREWVDAERFYLAEIQAAGLSVRMLNNLAGTYQDRGEVDMAIETYTELIAYSDTAPEPHDNLAHIYLERRQFANAEAEFRLALEIAPNFIAAMEGLRDLYDLIGENAKAFEIDKQLRVLRRGLDG
jgi:hypothetical protein